ncbi:hypothetical protein F2P56_026695 [Juglans regia]|uniref:RNase H type-1 domain-containing protein n=1 Tax=Juglans regia TaxID=51240 RepID=A0A833U528_JUGRE|nr:hypothetical protein F2P56_026695 [Juglans regia]
MGTNEKIQLLLDDYEKASGQCINKEKTSMVFSKNVDEGLKTEIMQLWGGSSTQQYEKYLGLPPMVGRSKQRAFSGIKHRLWQKLQVWKRNLISQGGREVLVKAVAMSLPTYAMSCFLFPKSLCHELEMMMARFWWGNQTHGKKIHWARWEKLCAPKFRGGLGFKKLSDFNLALLAKQGWRLLTHQNSLLFRVFKARYFPNCSLFEAKIDFNASFVWKGIFSALPLLKSGCMWRVGNGRSIRVVQDSWIPGCSRDEVQGAMEHLNNEILMVNELIEERTGWWKIDVVRALFDPRLANLILKINICLSEEDSWFWTSERSGSYSVKSGYKVLQWEASQILGEGSRVLHIRDKGGLEMLTTFFVICWALWYRRNQFLYEKVVHPCSTVINNALSMQSAYKQVQVLDGVSKQVNTVLSWSPPPPGFLKLNVDGAIFPDHHKAGIGIILRDEKGDVIAACSKLEGDVASPEFIEATTLLRGLQFCAQWGVPKLVLETDCLILVNALQSQTTFLTDFAFLLNDISRMMRGFQEVQILHVNRLGNIAAHQLARNAWNVEDIVMWWGSCPSFVSQAVWLDKNNVM